MTRFGRRKTLVADEKGGTRRNVPRRGFLLGAGAGATGVVAGLVGCVKTDRQEIVKLPASGRICWDPDKCAACSRCLMACAAYHTGAVAPQLSAIRWMENEFLSGFRFRKPLFCNQCDFPHCYYACRVRGAMEVDSATGARYIDSEKCTGCWECFDECPQDIPRVTKDEERKVAFKCDLCMGREGGPVCVEVCDRGAITYNKRGGLAHVRRIRREDA
jgi:anaerobic carbon-monoxide dehydrogenase iron sulfur subunit